jgi:hypothetical protein
LIEINKQIGFGASLFGRAKIKTIHSHPH